MGIVIVDTIASLDMIYIYILCSDRGVASASRIPKANIPIK